MPIEILMPALSPTMTEGTLAKWCKTEGDEVISGDVIAEIETDKATMEVEAIEDGTLGKILIPAGTKGIAVNSAIGVLLLKGEDKSALKDIKEKSESIFSAETEETEQVSEVSHADSHSSSECSNEIKIFASPLAKRIASQNDVDLSVLKGSGPKGRVVKADVLEIINTPCDVNQQLTIKARQVPSKVEINGLRRAIADKLTESKQTAPHFYLYMEASVDKLLEMRADINLDNESKQIPKISVNDLIVKAIALAFKDVPEANVSWQGDHIEQYNNVDASVAVSVEGGIFTPIIKDADQKSVFEISKEVKALAARAKTGELNPAEFLGGSFTISNLGMYGIDSFSAILNSPQSCIFAVGAAKKVPVVKKDKVVVGSLMSITCSCDHRAIDGAVCAKLMNAVKGYLENPFKLLI